MKVVNVIKNIILDIIIVVLVISIVLGFLNKDRPVSVFNYYFFTVLTGSMQDTLNVGDNIISKKVDSYKVGDIVTYKKGNSYVTHRIVKIDGDMVTTKGDANNFEDPAFDKKDIVCKFVYKSDWLNFIIKYRVLFIFLIIILYLIESILKSDNKKVV